jgi:hypothetical protein
MAKSGPPPVPPTQTAPMGGTENPQISQNSGDMSAEVAKANKAGRRNLEEQGRQGNIKQNTTHKGYQQDR